MKTVNSFPWITIFVKSFILDIWLGFWYRKRTAELFFRGRGGSGWRRVKIARKILLHKNKLMIRSTINIHNMLKKQKNISLWFWKQSHHCVKRLVLIGIQRVKECKSIVNGSIKTISDNTLYKLHLTKILNKRLFDRHPILSK